MITLPCHVLSFCQGGNKGPENLKACSKEKKWKIYWRPNLGLLAPKPRSLYTTSHFLNPLNSRMFFIEGLEPRPESPGASLRGAYLQNVITSPPHSVCRPPKPPWWPFPLEGLLPVLLPALPLLHSIPTLTTIAGDHSFAMWGSVQAPKVPVKTTAWTAHFSKPTCPWSTYVGWLPLKSPNFY